MMKTQMTMCLCKVYAQTKANQEMSTLKSRNEHLKYMSNCAKNYFVDKTFVLIKVMYSQTTIVS